MFKAKINHLSQTNHVLADGVRFLFAGGANTLLSLVVYQVLLLVVSYSVAYALSWVVGLTFLLIVYPSRVFPGGKSSFSGNVKIVSLYLVTFMLGLLALDFLVDYDVNQRIAIFLVLIITTAFNFVFARMVYRR